uniref:Uncharacterized protein n=1 Tax=Arion vulgaris TaxID=1028688 RepID=A0A0B7ARA3_9EUPU
MPQCGFKMHERERESERDSERESERQRLNIIPAPATPQEIARDMKTLHELIEGQCPNPG